MVSHYIYIYIYIVHNNKLAPKIKKNILTCGIKLDSNWNPIKNLIRFGLFYFYTQKLTRNKN